MISVLLIKINEMYKVIFHVNLFQYKNNGWILFIIGCKNLLTFCQNVFINVLTFFFVVEEGGVVNVDGASRLTDGSSSSSGTDSSSDSSSSSSSESSDSESG